MPEEVKATRAPTLPDLPNQPNLTASLAAAAAYKEGKTDEECFEAAKEAVGQEAEQIAEAAEQEAAKLEALLRQEYFQSICNTVRADSLSLDDARKAAATLNIPTCTYQEWRRRLGL